jgi:hypothetical protein
VGAELVHVARWTDIMKLIGTFHNYGKAHKNGCLHAEWADFLHFQRLLKLKSLTLYYAVRPFPPVDVAGEFLCYKKNLEAIPFGANKI